MTLKITTGKQIQPPRIGIYGPPGVGKSTLAADAQKPIFIDLNDGTSNIDCVRAARPSSFDELLGTIADLTNEATEFKTFVLDTLDDVEALIWSCVVADYNRATKAQKVMSVGDIPYGRGPEAAVDYWRRLLASLERLWKTKNMTIILVDHSTIRRFKNPIEEDYERIEPKIDRRAAALIRGWCDALLFLDFKVEIAADKQTKRARGISTGERVIRTTYSASFDAKNRYGLPDEMELAWEPLAKAIRASMSTTPEKKEQ